MTKELQEKLQKLICKLSDISAKIEDLAFENELPEMLRLMEKCEKEIERPAQAMINAVG